MINVSKAFREQIKDRTDFREWAQVTFADGTVAYFGQQKDMPSGVTAVSEFTIGNNSVTNAADSQTFPLGVAISRHVQLEIANPYDDNGIGLLDKYAWLGARILLRLYYDKYQYDDEGNLVFDDDGNISYTTTYISFGYYTVTTPETYGTVVSVTAFDDMYKADQPVDMTKWNDYIGDSRRVLLRTALRNICYLAGITFSQSSFPNSSWFIPVANITASMTYRQVIGYIAMLAGGNAVIDRSTNRLKIVNYDLTYYDLFDDDELDGGTYAYAETAEISGGDYITWTDDEELSGGTYYPWSTDQGAMQVLEDFTNLTLDTDDIVITGLECTVTTEDSDGNSTEETKVYPAGASGYNISIDNPLMIGEESVFMPRLETILVGARFRKFEGDHISYPLAEFADHVIVTDRLGKMYNSVLTDVDFNFGGSTTLKNSAESAVRNSSAYASAETKAVQAAEKLITRERTAREQAVQDLNESINAASGLYSYEVKESDGSTTTYLYDIKSSAKPPYVGSNVIIKINAGGIGICTDKSGKNFQYGYDFTTNDAVLNVLSAQGINADWITAGTLNADLLKAGVFEVTDSNGDVVFSVNADKTKLNPVKIGSLFANRSEIYYNDSKNIVTMSGNRSYVFGAGAIEENGDVNWNFYVTQKGFLHATGAKIEGEITATTGQIGDLLIKGNTITSGTGDFSFSSAGLTVQRTVNGEVGKAVLSSGGLTLYKDSTVMFRLRSELNTSFVAIDDVETVGTTYNTWTGLNIKNFPFAITYGSNSPAMTISHKKGTVGFWKDVNVSGKLVATSLHAENGLSQKLRVINKIVVKSDGGLTYDYTDLVIKDGIIT